MAPTALDEIVRTDDRDGAWPVCQIVTPVGMMGYGFHKEWTEQALAQFSQYPGPTAIVLDSGSTDSGPSKLALGTTTCPASSYKRDFRKLIQLSRKYHAPILLSSAGGDGSDEHVDLFEEIVRELAAESGNEVWNIKAVLLYSQVDKHLVKQRLHSGQITGCGPSVPQLTEVTIHETPRVVAQMGPEPFMDAMLANPEFDLLIGGRAYDPAPYIAWAAYHWLGPKQRDINNLSPEALGCLAHMGKILECGGLCAIPKAQGAMAVVNSNCTTDITPLDPQSRCTPLSIAAHSLYEKTRPDILPGPGGYLDVGGAKYTQLGDGRTVRVRGSIFHLSRQETALYTVKLEGAKVSGSRTLMMGSFGDPILIPLLDAFLQQAKAFAKAQHAHVRETYDIGFHVYGFNEKYPDIVPSQVFVVVETIAETQGVATSLASSVRTEFAHGAYDGRKATSGNFGMGIGGNLELETGPCAEFSIYHLMELTEGEERACDLDSEPNASLFHWRSVTLGAGAVVPEVAHTSGQSGEQYNFETLRAPSSSNIAPTQSDAGPAPPQDPRTLADIASIVRSKNAGPFEITIDIMFDNDAVFSLVKDCNLLSAEVIAGLYGIETSEVVWAGFFAPARAFKATIPRRRDGKPSCSGGYMEDDVHGSQKYGPVLDLALPLGLIQEFRKIA